MNITGPSSRGEINLNPNICGSLIKPAIKVDLSAHVIMKLSSFMILPHLLFFVISPRLLGDNDKCILNIFLLFMELQTQSSYLILLIFCNLLHLSCQKVIWSWGPTVTQTLVHMFQKVLQCILCQVSRIWKMLLQSRWSQWADNMKMQ